MIGFFVKNVQANVYSTLGGCRQSCTWNRRICRAGLAGRQDLLLDFDDIIASPEHNPDSAWLGWINGVVAVADNDADNVGAELIGLIWDKWLPGYFSICFGLYGIYAHILALVVGNIAR